MKLRLTADFAEHVCYSYRNKASTCPVLVYEFGIRVFGPMSVISLRIL
jgi:hypothetical protein